MIIIIFVVLCIVAPIVILIVAACRSRSDYDGMEFEEPDDKSRWNEWRDWQ